VSEEVVSEEVVSEKAVSEKVPGANRAETCRCLLPTFELSTNTEAFAIPAVWSDTNLAGFARGFKHLFDSCRSK